jgi:hypothetical protein
MVIEKVLRSGEEADCRTRVDAAFAEELLTASFRLSNRSRSVTPYLQTVCDANSFTDARQHSWGG